MSLVLTVVVPEFVVQVSETRISVVGGKVPQDDQRKSVILFGDQFRGLVGWVGLATANPGHNTGDWLVEQLRALACEPVNVVVTGLAARATRHFATLRDEKGRPVRAKSEFVFAGWPTAEEPQPIYVSVCKTAEATEFSVREQIVSKTRPVKRPTLIGVSGWEPVADDFRAKCVGLKRLLMRGAAATTAKAVCLDIMRLAAGKYGKSGPVGPNVMAVTLPRDRDAEAAFYPWDGAETHTEYTPDLVTARMALKRIETTWRRS